MPWDRNADLPPAVRGALPDAALTIFRHAANAHLKRHPGDDAGAAQAGWSAVKAAGYGKSADGKWKKLTEENMVRYTSIKELPKGVKDDLPIEAQRLYLVRYNEAYEKHRDDALAHLLAMDAVSRSFVRKGSKWTRRLSEEQEAAFGLNEPVSLSAVQVDPDDPTTVNICREGRWQHKRYGRLNFTEAVLRKLLENFENNVVGSRIPCDYEHDIFNPLVPGDQKKAAGWIQSLHLARDADGTHRLYAKVEWTPTALTALQNKEFGYISPVIAMNYQSKETGKDVGPTLRAIALTNVPFLTRLQAIAASEPAEDFNADPQDGLRVKLAEHTGGPMDALIAKVKELALDFAGLLQKLQAATVEPAREIAAFVMLMVNGDIGADTAEVELPKESIRSLSPEWAQEMDEAGTESVTLKRPDDAAVQKALTALGSATTATASEASRSGAQAGGDEEHPAGAKSITVTKIVKFNEEEKVKKETERLRRRVAELELSALRNRLAQLREPNAQGFALPPAACDKAEALLVALHEGKGEAIILSDKLTVPNPTEAILAVLSEVREAGLIKVGKDTKDGGKGRLTGDFGGLLKFSASAIPEAVTERYRKRLGADVSAESIVLNELTDALLAQARKDGKVLSRAVAMHEAEALIASAKD